MSYTRKILFIKVIIVTVGLTPDIWTSSGMWHVRRYYCKIIMEYMVKSVKTSFEVFMKRNFRSSFYCLIWNNLWNGKETDWQFFHISSRSGVIKYSNKSQVTPLVVYSKFAFWKITFIFTINEITLNFVCGLPGPYVTTLYISMVAV